MSVHEQPFVHLHFFVFKIFIVNLYPNILSFFMTVTNYFIKIRMILFEHCIYYDLKISLSFLFNFMQSLERKRVEIVFAYETLQQSANKLSIFGQSRYLPTTASYVRHQEMSLLSCLSHVCILACAIERNFRRLNKRRNTCPYQQHDVKIGMPTRSEDNKNTHKVLIEIQLMFKLLLFRHVSLFSQNLLNSL